MIKKDFRIPIVEQQSLSLSLSLYIYIYIFDFSIIVFNEETIFFRVFIFIFMIIREFTFLKIYQILKLLITHIKQ